MRNRIRTALRGLLIAASALAAATAAHAAPPGPTARSDPAPTMLALPYVQPGDAPGPEGPDDERIIWVTDPTPAGFSVEYGWEGQVPRTAVVTRTAIDLKAGRSEPTRTKPAKTRPAKTNPAKTKPADDPEDAAPAGPPREQHYLAYRAALTGLPPDIAVWYRVKHGDSTVREDHFRTRASSDHPVRFVAVGDLANGEAAQDTVAFQVSLAKPDFLVALGDIVYPTGRVSQYMDHFWRTYDNVEAAGPKAGAPLMASIPFHVVLGNHDVDTSLSVFPDALGAYYFFHSPPDGPGAGRWSTPVGRDQDGTTAFRAAAGDSYPALGFYSFDNGPAHFVILDDNGYVKLDAPELVRWVEQGLARSKAKWKFVCAHAPAFHSSPEHYTDQKLRRLEPVFEQGGVDVVFAGHVHNYQRSRPLRFEPAPPAPGDRLVDGKYTIDTQFDGNEHTRPRGILHIVSGGGGGTLYRTPLEKTVSQLQQKFGDNYAPYTVKLVADRHSFVVCELSPERMLLRAIDSDGGEIDRIIVTKP